MRNQIGAAMGAAMQRTAGRIRGGIWEGKAVCQPHILTSRNATRPPVHFEVLHEIFEAQADWQPDAVAVLFGREKTTYAQLEQRANRLAHYLRAQGVGCGWLVALLLPRSVDAYVSMLGILKAGAACVPIHPAYPLERVARILEDSDARALVTTAALSKSCGDTVLFSGVVVRVDTDVAAIGTQSCERVPRTEISAFARDLCYVNYACDETRSPNRVVIEHRDACKRVCAEGEIFKVQPGDRVYHGLSHPFDTSVEEAWLAFHAGATLVVLPPDLTHASPDLSRTLKDAGVTVLSCKPILLSTLKEDVPTVRLLILGGSACPDHLAEHWARPGRRMVNTCGLTEDAS